MTINLTLPPSFAKSWKTTLVGVGSAVLGIHQVSTAIQSGDFKSLAHDPTFYLALFGALQGFVSKDANVTGGTVGQPSTAKALTEANVTPAAGAEAPKP